MIASRDAQAQAGAIFELEVVAPPGATLPDTLAARLKAGVTEVALALQAEGVAADGRRRYTARMPSVAAGPVSLELAERPSNRLLLLAQARGPAPLPLPLDAREPPLSAEDPMYFVAGSSGPTTARFQLSFKYRLFDAAAGIGQERPWLSGLYFGYTQNSLWDLSTESKAFRDTSYRPALFWSWERTDERSLIDGARVGVEHESNGDDGERSRSINIAFVRPEWRWKLQDGASFEFTPKLYTYLDKAENPDIGEYRGHVDWRTRFDSGENWIATAVMRLGTAGKGSVLLDVSRRIRDLKFGPVSGYVHVQVFAGYGEDIVDYNVKRKSQIRVGFAIVP